MTKLLDKVTLAAGAYHLARANRDYAIRQATEEHTYAEVAKHAGISRSRVFQIAKQQEKESQ